jgi:hypothetical protein
MDGPTRHLLLVASAAGPFATFINNFKHTAPRHTPRARVAGPQKLTSSPLNSNENVFKINYKLALHF